MTVLEGLIEELVGRVHNLTSEKNKQVSSQFDKFELLL
jgi:Mg2+/Co2+ transporter CorB